MPLPLDMIMISTADEGEYYMIINMIAAKTNEIISYVNQMKNSEQINLSRPISKDIMIVKKETEEKLDFLTSVNDRLEKLDSDYRELNSKIDLNRHFTEQRFHSIYLDLKS